MQIQHESSELCPGQGLSLCAQYDLDFGDMTLVQCHNIYPWIMENNCVKYYPSPASQYRVMVQTRIIAMYAVWP